jgi:hypothetical protein
MPVTLEANGKYAKTTVADGAMRFVVTLLERLRSRRFTLVKVLCGLAS